MKRLTGVYQNENLLALGILDLCISTLRFSKSTHFIDMGLGYLEQYIPNYSGDLQDLGQL